MRERSMAVTDLAEQQYIAVETMDDVHCSSIHCAYVVQAIWTWRLSEA